jgi:hypothetical protein
MHHLLRREHADGLSLCEPREQQGTSCSCASMPSHPLHTSSLSHTLTPPPPRPIGLQQEVAEGDKHVAMQQRVTASTKKRRTRERPALAKLLVVTTMCVRAQVRQRGRERRDQEKLFGRWYRLRRSYGTTPAPLHTCAPGTPHLVSV